MPKGGKLDRCVTKVKAKGDAVNPWAVYLAAVGRTAKRKTRKTSKKKGRKR